MKGTYNLRPILSAILVCTMLLLTACTGQPEATASAAPCAHMYEEKILVEGSYMETQVRERVCLLCGDVQIREIPGKNSIRILSVGNSFSEDALQYLWSILCDAGFREVTVAYLYIGGSSLDVHWDHAQTGAEAYLFCTNRDGRWQKENGVSLESAIKAEDWDFITLQQASPASGIGSSYGNLQNMVDYINERKTNEAAKICWHMTWAYQADSTHSGFAAYGNDQLRMYQDIVQTVRSVVEEGEGISGIIPCGTSLQNLRTTSAGDTLTRDGYHLSYGIGRYTAALTWYACITRMPVEKIGYIPEEYADTIRPCLGEIRKAVAAAIEKPYQVTECA